MKEAVAIICVKALTLSREKEFLSSDFMVIGRVVIRVKLVVRTAVGPPGLSTEIKTSEIK